MNRFRGYLSRFAATILAGRRDEDRLRIEIEEHLEMQTAEYIRSGMSRAEARRHAVLKFGAIEAIKEEYRDQRGIPFLEALFHDVRHSLRRLRNSPTFAATTILTLALGIGATTSIFTLVHAVLLKSLPVSKPEQLYRLGREPHCCVWGGYSQGSEFAIVSTELYDHFRNHTQGFEELAAFQAASPVFGVRRVQGGSNPAAESADGKFVSGNYFAMFGVGAYAGRTLTPADDQAGAPLVAVISYRAWQKYGLDPSVIGGAFQINGQPFTVVGVAPPGFYGDSLKNSPPAFFLPLQAEPLVQSDSSMLRQADRHWLNMIGRIRPGAQAATVEAQMQVELQNWLRSHVADMNANDRTRYKQQVLHLEPGGAGITSMRHEYEHWLQILMMVSGFVLLIVCANVANLLLVRGMERRQQTSLSMALGARPTRLIREALTESVVLSLLGGIAGIAVAFAGTRLILNLTFQNVVNSPIEASPSLPVLGFAFAVSLLTGIAFGIAPAWLASRADPIEALRGRTRSTTSGASLPRKMLVVLQASLTLALLCASGLLTKTLQKLEHLDLGFQREHRMVVNLDPTQAGYRSAQLESLYNRLRDSLGAIPGVESVAFCLYSPQGGDSWNDMIFIGGKPAPGPAETNVAWMNRITPGYFETVGSPVSRGRGIGEQDTASSRRIAVISEGFARKFFKDEDPIGKHFGNAEFALAGNYEVVGVVKDAYYISEDLGRAPVPMFFLPETQSSVYARAANNSGEARSHVLHDAILRMRPGAPAIPDEQVRRALASVDPNLPAIRIQTMETQVEANFSQQRLIARLTSLFGMLALTLASIGLYGVTAYTVGSRTGEIGVRMALGASRRSVISMILRGASALIAFGLLLGLPLALAAGQFLGSQLYGLNDRDPEILMFATLALLGPAWIAALIPAFRASSISPVQALRAE